MDRVAATESGLWLRDGSMDERCSSSQWVIHSLGQAQRRSAAAGEAAAALRSHAAQLSYAQAYWVQVAMMLCQRISPASR